MTAATATRHHAPRNADRRMSRVPVDFMTICPRLVIELPRSCTRLRARVYAHTLSRLHTNAGTNLRKGNVTEKIIPSRRAFEPVYTILSRAGKNIVIAKPGCANEFASHCREVVSPLMNPNTANDLDRRRFLLTALGGAGGAWASVHWPAILEAAQHAAHMREAVPRPNSKC
jgi:hypothetical protein